MKYVFTLKDKETGFQRDYEDGQDWIEEVVLFMWLEGNYSCDCNRALFLWDRKGPELECNNVDNRIELVSIRERESGVVIYHLADEADIPVHTC